MDNQQRALNYLGLARRGSNIAIGEEPVGIACRGNHGRLLILAKDAADHTFRRARSYTQNGKPPMIRVNFTKDELGTALGCNACAMAVFTDVALALAFVQALGEPEKHSELLAALEEKSIRAEQRQKEEKAHQKNLRRGGKKK